MRFGGLCKKSKHLTRTQNAKIIMRVDFCHLHAHAHSHRAFARRPTWDMPVNIQHTISPIETVFVNAISLVSLSDARTLFVRAISCAIHALIAYHSAFSLNFKCSRAVHDTHVRHMATQNRHHLTDDMNCVFFSVRIFILRTHLITDPSRCCRLRRKMFARLELNYARVAGH